MLIINCTITEHIIIYYQLHYYYVIIIYYIILYYNIIIILLARGLSIPFEHLWEDHSIINKKYSEFLQLLILVHSTKHNFKLAISAKRITCHAIEYVSRGARGNFYGGKANQGLGFSL